MFTYSYIKPAVLAILIAFLSFGNYTPCAAQGCAQPEIGYDQPDCYKSKNGGGSAAPNRDCTPVTVCANQQYSYTANGGPWATYLWTISGGPVSPVISPSATSANVSINWTVPGTYILTLTVTDGMGNTYTKCIEVTAKDKPLAGFNFSPNNACAGSIVNFTNTTTFSGTPYYSWNFGDPASGPANNSNAANPSHIYNTAGSYVVTLIAYSSMLVPGGNGGTGKPGDSLTLVTCCADTIKKTVTVVNGNVKIECISTVCAGAVSKYTAVGCVSPTWGTPVGGTVVSTSGNTITIQWGSGSPQGQLSVSCGGGCTAYAAVPILPTTTIITGNTAPCNTGPATYSVPYLPGTFYTWTLTNITTAANANNLLSTYPDNNTVLINWSLATPGNTYQLTINLTNPHLCCNSTGNLTIVPKQIYSISAPLTICAGQPGTFSPTQPGTYSWSVLPSAGVTPPSAVGGSYTATFTIPAAYVVTATNFSGTYCNSTASAGFNVVAVPTPGVIQGPVTACAGSTYAYNMSTPAPAGYFYEWTVTNGTFQPTGSTTTTGDNVNIKWTTLSGTISVVLKQSAAPFCSVSVLPLTVNAATVGSVSGPVSVCVDGTGAYILSGGTAPPGTIITWSISPASLGTIISGQGTNGITVLWHGQGGAGPWGPATISASTGCGPATPLGGIMIYPKFTVNITSSGVDICQTGGVSLTANGAPVGATYLWSPGGATSQTINNITSPGTYAVTATAGGCSASATFVVQDPFQIGPTTCGVGICNGTGTNEGLGIQIQKPASGTFTYEWHSGQCPAAGPILSTTTTTALTNNFLATASGYYCVLVKYGNCQKCYTFLVKKVCCPDINHPVITNKTQLTCDQYSFTGTANPTGATLTWNFGDGSTAPGVSGVPITHTYSLAGIYCVTFCAGPPNPNPTSCTGNCTSTDAIVPLAPGFSYKLSCNGCLNVTNGTAIFGPTATVSYLWDFGDATTSTSQNPPQHCYAAGGTYVVKLTVTYAGAVTCVKTVQQTVVYTPLSITNNSPVCTGVPVSFASNPGGFVTYSWAFGDGFTGYTSPIVHAYNTSGPFSVNLSVTDALGNVCTKNATVNVLPGINGCSIQPAYLCPGSPATLTGPVGTFTYLWEVETTPNVFTPAPGVNNGATYTTTVAGNYHVIVTNGNGCSCTSNKVSVTAVAKPKASFSISPSKNLCSPGGIAILTAPSITGYTYAWYANGAYGTPVSTSPVFLVFVSTTTTYNLVVTNQYGCKDTCSMTITVSPLPAAPTVSASGLCAGVPVTLTVTNYVSNISWNTGATTTSIVTYIAGAYVATYTDPATGCSASTSTTINKRPSAGLFPHDCDSIPCKCSRPFVIYAPNPLIGNFASGYIYNWYDAITNTFLASGNPYNNGGLGVQTGSYVVVITDAVSGCKDTSNSYSVVVPPCDTCGCKGSTWGEMTLAQGENPAGNIGGVVAVKCGGKYAIECSKPYTLTAFYNCVGPACKGKVTYSLQPPVGALVTGVGPTISFTPNITGTYVLTLYGWCGNKPCDSCVIRFTVKCPCDCKGSKWGDIILIQNNEVIPAGNAVITPPSLLKCGKTYQLNCHQPYSINPTFICKDTGCQGKVTYSLLPPAGPAITGNAPVNFTPTQNGTYTLTLYGWCGEFICDSCVIKFDVICGCNCAESVFGDIILTQPVMDDVPNGAAVIADPQALKCGKTYALQCKKTYNLAATFICKDTACKGKVTYQLVPPSGPVVTGNAPLSFTPVLTGTYVLTLYGWCGDKICDSCVIKFTANCDCDCKGSKWGDKTLSNGNTTTALNCKQYEWNCNVPFTVNAAYSCSNPAVCNSATTYQLTTPSGSPVTGSLPLTYTPTVSGTYAVVLYGYCGGKVCDSCVVTFKMVCPPVCCKYEIKVQPGAVSYALAPAGDATIATQSFAITGLTGVNLTEVRAEVLSFDISSNFDNKCMACKAFPFLWASINSAGNIGAVPAMINLYNGSTTNLFNPTGAAVYQNPREVVWNNGTNFNMVSPVSIKLFLPPPPTIDCCVLKGKICVKFTFRDMNCNECEVIACFDIVIKK